MWKSSLDNPDMVLADCFVSASWRILAMTQDLIMYCAFTKQKLIMCSVIASPVKRDEAILSYQSNFLPPIQHKGGQKMQK